METVGLSPTFIIFIFVTKIDQNISILAFLIFSISLGVENGQDLEQLCAYFTRNFQMVLQSSCIVLYSQHPFQPQTYINGTELCPLGLLLQFSAILVFFTSSLPFLDYLVKFCAGLFHKYAVSFGKCFKKLISFPLLSQMKR